MIRSLFLVTLAFPFAATPAFAHEVLHAGHDAHSHGKGCGHQALEHAGHVDFLHDGHLHHTHAGHIDEHAIEVSSTNPEAEELAEAVTSDDHMHGHADEEHLTVQHGTHVDYVHDGRLHHVHGDHADDHGSVTLLAAR